jgi:hypothetical protein
LIKNPAKKRDSPHLPPNSINEFVLFIFSCVFLLSLTHTPLLPDTHTSGNLSLVFKIYVHGQPLLLNKEYKNPFGERFTISRFRFYVGHFSPLHTKGTDLSASYHLVDLSDSASCQIRGLTESGTFHEFQFILGVDSVAQVSGAQTGALDPLKGMFWTWNSGYQSFKIEGTSPQSDQPSHLIAYHVGGYRFPYSTVWSLKFSCGDTVRLLPDKTIRMEIPWEMDDFFEGPHAIRIKDLSDCMTPGEQSRRVSENFISAFRMPVIRIIP